MNYIWIAWLVLAAVFIIGEMFTAGFVMFWFGIGAGVAALLALVFPTYVAVQISAFVVVSLILFAISRKFANRITVKPQPGIGANRAVGRRGVVIETIDPVKATGQVRIDRDEWRADSENDQVIEAGQNVIVVNVEGSHVVVKVAGVRNSETPAQ